MEAQLNHSDWDGQVMSKAKKMLNTNSKQLVELLGMAWSCPVSVLDLRWTLNGWDRFKKKFSVKVAETSWVITTKRWYRRSWNFLNGICYFLWIYDVFEIVTRAIPPIRVPISSSPKTRRLYSSKVFHKIMGRITSHKIRMLFQLLQMFKL